MAVNGDGPAVTSLFNWPLPTGTGAEGSLGAADHPAAPDDAYTTQATTLYESVQNRPVPRVSVGADDVNQPAQLVEGLSGVDISTTGAGQGSNVMQGHHPNSSAVRS